MDGRPADAVALRTQALECLMRWAPYAESHWWCPPDRPELGCFGTGYNGWGVQTNQKYVAACAVLAADPAFDPSVCRMSREQLLDRALRALRFSLASHMSGPYHCADGTQWGRTWISALGVERMMHGVEALQGRLTTEDLQALRALVVSEADAQLDAEVAAAPWGDTGRNKPESNIWNGAILARATAMYPDEPHAEAWYEKASAFLLNGISVAADAADTTIVGGRPIREWHVEANFFPHYALDHHGYLNVGYMAICLSNVAMLHFGFRARGLQPPAALYHHAADLWGLLRRLIFPNGRLIRIGGDTRQRYCYCQDYLLPALLWAADYVRDPDALALAGAAMGLMRMEQEFNADGSFLGKRLAHIAREDPYYYTRLESDKAASLSMAAHWMRRFEIASPKSDLPFEESVRGGWEEPEHGAAFHRSPARVVSWSWRAAEGPQGLCLPPDCGHMAEWEENLAGCVLPAGVSGRRKVHWHWLRSFDGGFLTMGKTNEGAQVELQEGWRRTDLVDHRIVFAALPDNHTAVRLELASIGALRVYIRAVEGVSLRVANDLFNAVRRTYYTRSGALESAGAPEDTQCVALDSPWVNAEDLLGLIGIYGSDSWSLVRERQRRGGYAGSIFSDRLCFPARHGLHNVCGPAGLLDTGCIIVAFVDRSETERLWRESAAVRLDCREAGARAVLISAQDGERYLLAANFSDLVPGVTVSVPEGVSMTDLCSGRRMPVPDDGVIRLDVSCNSAALLRVDGR